jgi:3-deoxy-D-manno-octulosonic-acid transferase
METELWPNLVALAAKRGVRLMLANARLSAKSAAQYAKRPKLSRPMLQRLDVIAVQTQVEAQRFIELGVSQDRVTVCGSLKFDLSITPERLANAKQLRQAWGRETSPIWVAGSVHPGEFDAMLTAHRQLLAQWPDALLIIAPRHPEQFSAVAEFVASQGFESVRRSGNFPVTATTQVLVGDTMGELLTFYGAADQAFVGGTLINNGGHNPLEPVAMGVPVMVGPNHWDFAQITQMLADAGGLRVVASADELAANLIEYFAKPELRLQAVNAGLAVVEANRGALQRQFLLAQSLITA